MPLIKKKTKKATSDKKNKINAMIFFSNIIEVILVLSIIILFYITIPLSSSKVIFIPKGSTNYIITYLNKSGYDLNIIDKVIIKIKGYPQSGWIDLKTTKMTKADFINKLLTSKAALKSVTLIPGETAYFFLKDISEKFNLSFTKLQNSYNKYAYRLDGNILAETYNLPMGMDEDHIIFYLISYTNKRYEEFSNKIFGHYIKKSWYTYVTMASIIQKEAADTEEMPIVSSVIQNRLKRKMPLQMDGTLNYGVYSHTKVTPKMIREDITSYNTYKYSELPKNPVCAVSLDAIKAAIFPAKTEYLYFFRNKATGKHSFTKTYKEHINNINRKRTTSKPKETKVFPKKSDTKTTKDVKSLWKAVK
ncbi:endolytic transglycosylase MltG [uncultured Arcobacter sp.]|uniref:endolytic transglycosylase MltG n=1 Tax=uncultured Arcobacter sp. TaxID=165434 RepID=UPI00344F4738